MGSSPKSSNPEKKRRCKCTMNFASLFAVGAPEALVIGVVALLVFGPKGLDEVSVSIFPDFVMIDLYEFFSMKSCYLQILIYMLLSFIDRMRNLKNMEVFQVFKELSSAEN
ncbi:Sec-independent protein translocase protein TatA/B/E [Arabidopsis thaliana x Arabidopsis arenosa]|uniref:Sec-independent protein translocase protein TatA/B/E n=1 Tax=Arabidopsis thaliana x Arabidopsis arenosa TaxID=1240361 RepID=A0A8T1XIY6_9BRAS|nr:Sec-independent protein translocase protein TatA/B/E [Arabidopsis thaliana x Arabidopsis arenosa]